MLARVFQTQPLLQHPAEAWENGASPELGKSLEGPTGRVVVRNRTRGY